MSESKKLNNLKEILDNKGIKASHVAKKLDVSTQTLYNWIHQRSQPSLHKLSELSKLIDVPMSELINEDHQ